LIMVKNILRLLALGLVLAVGGGAHAGPVGTGIWYQFYFQGDPATSTVSATGCSDAICTAGPSATTTFADSGPWTFDVGPGGATLNVTDAFLAGDSFEIFNGLGSLGRTPSVLPVPQNPLDCGEDPADCFGTNGISFNSFALPTGSYSLTVSVIESPAMRGSAFFEVLGDTNEIPTPGTLTLMSLALFCLGAVQWTRNHGPSARRGRNLLAMRAR
jgi:hypothetical protein